MKLPFLALAALLLGTASAVAEVPKVVATIKPIHSLVAAVMGDLGSPTLIVKGAASPHTYSLKPSEAGAIEAADIVFWTGHGLEVFLEDSLSTLAPTATLVELADSPGITLLPVREGGAFDAHDHGGEDDHAGETAEEHAAHADEAASHDDHAEDGEHEDHEGHDEHAEGDMHFWLDPQNAKLMVSHIAATLATADPDNAAAYAANAEVTLAGLDALQAELAEALKPAQGKPFVVFHDAYQYFETRFGLTLAGTVTVTPDTMPGAARIDELRAKVSELGATCVFAEPNFEPAVVETIIEGTMAKAGVLDPEGGALTEGVNLYPDLLRGLAAGLADCLE